VKEDASRDAIEGEKGEERDRIENSILMQKVITKRSPQHCTRGQKKEGSRNSGCDLRGGWCEKKRNE